MPFFRNSLSKPKMWVFTPPVFKKECKENKPTFIIPYELPARIAMPARHADASHAGWQNVAGGRINTNLRIIYYFLLYLPHTKFFVQTKAHYDVGVHTVNYMLILV